MSADRRGFLGALAALAVTPAVAAKMLPPERVFMGCGSRLMVREDGAVLDAWYEAERMWWTYSTSVRSGGLDAIAG